MFLSSFGGQIPTATATILGMLWIYAAATIGGVVCSVIAPTNKIAVASGTGFLFGGLVGNLFRRDIQ